MLYPGPTFLTLCTGCRCSPHAFFVWCTPSRTSCSLPSIPFRRIVAPSPARPHHTQARCSHPHSTSNRLPHQQRPPLDHSPRPSLPHEPLPRSVSPISLAHLYPFGTRSVRFLVHVSSAPSKKPPLERIMVQRMSWWKCSVYEVKRRS